MDLKSFVIVFGTVFLAELGDKTQLAVLSLAAASRAPWSVFLGASLGLAAATGIAVVVGSLLGATLPERWIRLGAGLLFVAMGVWMLAGSWRQA